MEPLRRRTLSIDNRDWERCPFCDNEVSVTLEESNKEAFNGLPYYWGEVCCDYCDVQMWETGPNREKVERKLKEKWNTRY